MVLRHIHQVCTQLPDSLEPRPAHFSRLEKLPNWGVREYGWSPRAIWRSLKCCKALGAWLKEILDLAVKFDKHIHVSALHPAPIFSSCSSDWSFFFHICTVLSGVVPQPASLELYRLQSTYFGEVILYSSFCPITLFPLEVGKRLGKTWLSLGLIFNLCCLERSLCIWVMLYSTQAWQFFLCNAIMWNIKEMRTEVAVYQCEKSCSLW